MSLSTKVNFETRENNVYFSVTIRNPSIVEVDGKLVNNPSKFLQYDQSFSEPIIEDISRYNIALDRWSVRISNLKLMTFQVDPANPGFGLYYVSLDYKGTQYKEQVAYIAGSDLPSTDPRYYDIFEVSNFLQMINTAYLNAFTALKTTNPGITSTQSPWFYFNGSTGSTLCHVPFDFIADAITIRFSTTLYEEVLRTFQIDFNDNALQAIDECNFILRYRFDTEGYGPDTIRNLTNPLGSIEAKTTDDRLKVMTIYDTEPFGLVNVVSELNQLILTSHSLPVVFESSNQNPNLDEKSFNSFTLNKENRLLTFTVESIKNYKSEALVYYPSFLKKISFFDRAEALQRFDFQMYTLGEDGQLNPFFLVSGSTAVFNFVFTKKEND
jgi:hypothetical protein